jgi:MFS family permease
MMFLFRKAMSGITKNVVVISFVSFFNDIASEMIYPVVPIFLTTVLGAPVTIVGLIEGLAESTASILRVFSGWFSDKFQKRKPFMAAGYALSALSKLIMAVSVHWSMVMGGRFLDRFGKGVRTSARDALLAESCDASCRGRVFGFHRAIDTMGALVGPLVALVLLQVFNQNLRFIFFLAVIPSIVGVVLLVIFVKDIRRQQGPSGAQKLSLRDVKLSRDFKIFLIVSAIFAVGNSSDAFLVLRAQNLGFSLSLTILVYTVFNAAYALSSFPAGILSDRIGQKKVLLYGFCLFAVIYFLFGIVTEAVYLWILFPLYGLYMALTEGIGKAYISYLVDKDYTGTTYGIYQTLIGIMTFFSSLIAGFLWKYIGPGAPFIFAAIMAAAAFIIFVCARTEEPCIVKREANIVKRK